MKLSTTLRAGPLLYIFLLLAIIITALAGYRLEFGIGGMKFEPPSDQEMTERAPQN